MTTYTVDPTRDADGKGRDCSPIVLRDDEKENLPRLALQKSEHFVYEREFRAALHLRLYGRS
jgi:hypothetical protein